MEKITIKEAARRMGKSEQFVRVGLQQGVFDFGTAIKISPKRYSYTIYPAVFNALYGEEEPA